MSQASTEVDRHIGQRLRQHRLMRGIDEAAFAERIRITPTQLRLFEKGLKRVPPQHLIAAAEVLKVSIGLFFEDAPASSLAPSPTGINAEIVRFLSFPEAYPLISAFNTLETRRQRQSVVDAAREAAHEDASPADAGAA